MRGIVVEVQLLVSGVRHPVEMAENAVGKSIAPGAHQNRPDHHQADISENGEGEGEWYVQTHAELARDFDLSQRPGHEGPDRAHRDDLPETALLQRGEAKTVADVGGRDIDAPRIPGRADRRAIENHRDADGREDDGRDAEEADIERPDPEVEEVAPGQRSATDAVFAFEIQHSHCSVSAPSNARILIRAPRVGGWRAFARRPPASAVLSEIAHHERARGGIDLAGLDRMALEPVEAIRAEQNEVNDQRQHKEKREQPDQGPSRIEQKPNSVHDRLLSSGGRARCGRRRRRRREARTPSDPESTAATSTREYAR